jgi:hypothetical protein
MFALHRVTILAAAVAISAAQAAVAQTQKSISVVGGTSTDARGVRSSAVTLAPGVQFGVGGTQSMSLHLHGTRFASSEAWTAGGRAALALRERIAGGLSFTTHGAASATATSFNVAFRSAEVTPGLEWSWRPVTVFGGVRAVHGAATLSARVPRGPFPPVTETRTIANESVAPMYGARVRMLSPGADVGALIWLRADPMRVNGVRVHDRVLGATVIVNALTVSASSGRRDADDERATFGSVAASLAIAPGVSIDAAGGTYPSDRFTGAAGGRHASLGFTLRSGRARTPSLPAPAGARPPDVGVTRLSIRARNVERVEILGDWNDWTPELARRASNDVWYVDLRLPPGDYRYAFRVNGTEWRVPEEAVAVADGFGGTTAYVSVRGTASGYQVNNRSNQHHKED